MTKARTVLVGAMAVALLSVSSTANSQPARSVPARMGKVKIVDFAFQPSTITVPRGALVGWKNFGTVSHTSTSDDGRWNIGPILPGQSVGRYFNRAGTFPYHCEIHPTMTGTIVVNG